MASVSFFITPYQPQNDISDFLAISWEQLCVIFIDHVMISLSSLHRVEISKHTINLKLRINDYTITLQCNIKIFNPSFPGQNGRHFADDIFRYIFVNEHFCILIKISMKFVHKGPIDNNPAKIMAWRRICDKPLSEPMPTRFTDAYMRHSTPIR